MKNFKKVIILLITVIILVVYLIYNYIKEREEEIIVDDIYVESNVETEKIDKIILHITGEVKKPRNYYNR